MAVRLVATIAELRRTLGDLRSADESIGLVPTMGYLHAGHLALVHRARQENGAVVVSIFVNPLQFGPTEDLSVYPQDLGRDLALLAEGDAIVFAPGEREMYPGPMATHVALPELSQTLCGRSRPTHFQGVATVVLKLLWIVQPDRVYFGQKDGQQVAVVRRMLEDLAVPVQLRVVPTVREPDGLALSSRNVYLTAADRPSAGALHAALIAGRALLETGVREGARVQAAMEAAFAPYPNVRLDYAEVVEADTLRPLPFVEGRVLLAVAAWLGKARLIDNFLLEVRGAEVSDGVR